jgi:hypothetical protein
MSTILLDNNTLSQLRLRLPLYGAWTAECVHADPEAVPAVGSRVQITLESQTFSGTVYRTTNLGDMSWDTYIIGGAGKLQSYLSPKFYLNVNSREVLTDALSAVGEIASPTISGTSVYFPLIAWTRTRRTLGQELDALVKDLYLNGWRILSDGSVWLGEEIWQEATVSADVDTMSAGADDGVLVLACEDPTVLPGQTWQGAQVAEVIHSVSAKSTRTQLWLGDTDREAGALLGMVGQSLIQNSCWPYVVIRQAADGTVDLSPEDGRLPDLSGIPIYHGIPGCYSTIPAGTVCLVGFPEVGTELPRIVSWLPGPATNLALVANRLDLGTNPGMAAMGRGDLVNAELTKIAASIQNLVVAILSSGPTTPPTVIYGTPSCPKGDVSATKVFGT